MVVANVFNIAELAIDFKYFLDQHKKAFQGEGSKL